MFGGFLAGILSKILAFFSAAGLGLAAAAGGGGAGTHTQVTTPSTFAGSSTNVQVPNLTGLSSALSGLGSSLSSCVMKAVPSTGGTTTTSPSQIASEVSACVTSALGKADLPNGVTACVTAILSSVNTAIAGGMPKFNISSCLPKKPSGSGVGPGSGSGSGKGSGKGSGIPGIAGLSSVLSGLGTGVSSCVLKALSSAGNITASTSGQLASQISACVQSSTGSSTLPSGGSTCESAIMATVNEALAGEPPSFSDFAACIPGLSNSTGNSDTSGSNSSFDPFSGLASLVKDFSGLAASGMAGFGHDGMGTTGSGFGGMSGSGHGGM